MKMVRFATAAYSAAARSLMNRLFKSCDGQVARNGL
jgi:hypothetical protein